MLSRLMTRREQFVLLAVAVAVLTGSVVLYVMGASAPPPVPSIAEEAPPPASAASIAPSLPTAAALPAPAPVPVPAADPVPAEAPEPATVTVSVRGAVVRPGVYTLDPSARIQHLLEKAGGPAPEADLADINLAARLIDGTTLTVPVRLQPMDGARRGLHPIPPVPTMNPVAYTVSGWQAHAPAEAAPPVPSPAGAAPARATAGGPASDAPIDLNRASAQELETLPGIGPKLAQEIIRYRSQVPFSRVEDILNVSGIGEKRLEAIRPLVAVR